MKAVLISTYDLGHQPFGLASPAAWLRERGVEVTCLDLAVEELNAEHMQCLAHADAIAFYLPMHTATRIAIEVIKRARTLNPSAHLCAYGLYAPINHAYLEKLGVELIISGEYEQQLVSAILDRRSHRYAAKTSLRHIPKLEFRKPDRTSLPDLSKYAFLALPDGTRRTVGYTEASRGCKHLCRHCPVVPVYGGQFRIVQHDVVMADIDQLIENGAEHISFGDPDFFNGPKHTMQIAAALHRRYPAVTYDVTIKIEHLIRQSRLLPELKETGCAFVTSAVESVDDHILDILGKRHTRLDFLRVVDLFRSAGLTLLPTFVAFMPWTTLEGYRDLLQCILGLGLVANVAPVQLAIRLLIPEGSRLLDSTVKTFITTFDESALCYRWEHPDPRVDMLQREVEASVKQALVADGSHNRMAAFEKVWHTLEGYIELPSLQAAPADDSHPPKNAPCMSEPWYCCAEPTDHQMRPI